MKRLIVSAFLVLGLNAQGIPAKSKILCTPTYGSHGTYTVAIDVASTDEHRLVLVAYESFTPAGEVGLMSQFLKIKPETRGSDLVFETADQRFVLFIANETDKSHKEGEPYFAALSSDLERTHVDEQMGCLFYN